MGSMPSVTGGAATSGASNGNFNLGNFAGGGFQPPQSGLSEILPYLMLAGLAWLVLKK